ncbi:MAG TPA: phosphoenolpyruvate carboxykinase (ATP) [Thermoanaerobaculia bacterium]|jgi:phosphoenolpyruvate carboxykinase (ATP)|nr:phosphoenolpyruvate carboxykinase (ATP) [Thermoanaerobaculia bacterium]
MSTVEAVKPKKITARKIHRGLSGTDLRAMARKDETTSAHGSPVYSTRVKNRSAKDTYVVENGVLLGRHQKGMDPERAAELIRKLQESLAGRELIQVDRRMGMAPEAALHCRLFVPVEFARIAAMWHNMLFPIDASGTPDFVSVYVPDWPEKVIFLDPNEGYTYICGTDYPGEAKKSMLRQAMYWIKKRGGLGLHAGSKILRVAGRDGNLHDVGFLLFGLSGTGKTTLTLHDHGLAEPERVIIKQDDVVLLAADGRAYGTEDGFYIKTEGLEPSQRVLWDAAISPSACFENVRMRDDGTIDFCDTSLTSNGRGVVLRRFIHGTDDGIDLPRANKIVFITRRNDVVPVVARLTPEQGAAFFMLGESIETSAGDPTRAGQAKREVGTNPFIVGPEEEEGNRILKFLRENSDMEAYLLNTGAVGARDGSPGENVTIRVSSEIMKQIARDGIEWELDPDWGYQVPMSVPGIDLSKYDPRSHYSPEEYASRVAKLRAEREQWLAQFPGLDPSIPAAIEGRR